jgi:diguanylate cyclase (GGDEF)-like protein
MAHNGMDALLGLESCENEPILRPGFIQPHGVLLALEPSTLLIEQVSINSQPLLGLTPGELIGHTPAIFLGQRRFEGLAAAINVPGFETDVRTITVGPDQMPIECTSSSYRDSLLVELQLINGAHSLDLLDVSLSLHAPLARMERTSNVDELLSIVAQEIRAISGFDRVMVYQFDDDWHGVVLAEDVADGIAVEFLGLRFPASDMPAQSRNLYLLNTLRLIPDRDYVPVPIVDGRGNRSVLDLSRSELRSVSPIHIEYMRNIGVRATLMISIIVRGKLWGLIACHHNAPRRINHAVRSTCNFFAQMLSLKLTARIEHAELARRLDANERLGKFVAALESTHSLFEELHGTWADLLPLFDADALLVRCPEGTALYGSSLDPAELRNVVASLRARSRGGIASCASLLTLEDKARRFASEASGALYIGLSETDDSALVILRREQRSRVTWAGDPSKAVVREPNAARPSPRTSFAAWEELTRGESLRWSADDLEKAASLRRQLIEWQRAHEKVRLLAHYDTLTELPNRRLLDEMLTRSLSEAATHNELVGLLFIDVDRFKRFNDRLGHAAGDSVLRHVAARISRTVRESDIVGRLGGDEFVVIMPGLSSRAVAECVAQRLVDEIWQPIPGFEGHDLNVTLSIGISFFPADGTTSDALLSSADAAMYRVKESGRSAWQSYNRTPAGSSTNPRERSPLIAGALDRGEIVAHFQPVVDLADGRLVTLEALARWNHPMNGLLGPSTFIAAAEESDLIVRLGEMILDSACQQLSRWRRISAPALRVAVNVSPRQLRDFGFVSAVQRTLERYNLPASALELDITEGMLSGEMSQTIDALRELAGRGVRIAIDDFGTGYTSLNHLRRLPVNALKIDRSFVGELRAPKTLDSGAAIVNAIVSIAKRLGLEVIAEGVETQAQLELLCTFGCDFAQGYHVGRPIRAAAYSRFSLSDSAAVPRRTGSAERALPALCGEFVSERPAAVIEASPH